MQSSNYCAAVLCTPNSACLQQGSQCGMHASCSNNWACATHQLTGQAQGTVSPKRLTSEEKALTYSI